LIERIESVAALEASAAGIKWTFSPMVDIARDPRWGRIVEGSGEDPYLGAAIARARVRGFQGDDPGQPGKLMACAKHWVGYGAAEAGRDYNLTDISEHRLREIYFPPFKAAIDAGVGTFMSAFNDLNGIPASANPFTLRTVLRDEWGFKGFVVSDWESVAELIRHGVAADGKEAAYQAISAGVDMEMTSRTFIQNIPQLLSEGRLSIKTVDESVRRILRMKFRLGLFEHPYVDESREAAVLNDPEHIALAKEAEIKSQVLLKNTNQLLPLKKDLKSVAVIGAFADDQNTPLGWWKGDTQPQSVVTILSGIRAKVPSSTRIRYAKGCELNGCTPQGIAEAVKTAKKAEVAIVVVGESNVMSGEAASRAHLELSGQQNDLVKAVHATGTPVVVVLVAGRPLLINWIAENVPAVLEAWHGGQQVGPAVADILFGDANPGGKLPITFPRSEGQIPIYYNFKNTGRPADNSQERYRSKYQDETNAPLFPFGYGLSYSTFKLSGLTLDRSEIKTGEQVTVSVDIENTSSRAGDEVVQLYIRDVVASVTRPVKELKGFRRVSLQPGERKTIAFQLGTQELGFHNRDMKFIVEPGKFEVMVGTSSVEGLRSSFEVRD
jgi:beta-glucosidase